MKEIHCIYCRESMGKRPDDVEDGICSRCLMGGIQKREQERQELLESVSGDQFKRLRKSLGESQTDFGARFNVSQAIISQVENDKHLPSRKMIEFYNDKNEELQGNEQDDKG